MEADHPRFAEALAAMDAGDTAGLGRLLDEHPDLVTARVTSAEEPYDGYFHGATLLHHVAGNPIRGEMPENVVQVTRMLLEAGADPNATCGGGPSQPHTGGGDTLGLVATGAQAHLRSHSAALIDTLLEHGANLHRERGMFGTLYHTVEHRGQREVARMLHARGVEVDLPTAAGLGRLDLIANFFDADGRLVAEADRLWRHSPGDGAPGSEAEVLADALLAASANGWTEAVTDLLDRGAPIDMFRPWGPLPVTPLHGAAWAGWPEVVDLLLWRGADPELRDPTYRATALGWAQHSNRPECVRILTAARDASDPVSAFRAAVESEDIPRVQSLLATHEEARRALDAPIFSFAAQALVFAASRRNADLMSTLLDAGADIDAISEWEAGGFSALHHLVGAAAGPRRELARMLVDRGAMIDLHSAAGLGRLDLLEHYLDEAPERINEPGPDGTTPLHLALDVETARFLLDRGAALEQRCVDHNSTPAMWAIEDRPEVLRLLLERGATPDLFMAAVLDDVALAERVLQEDTDAIRSQTREGAFAHPPDGGDIYIWMLDFVDSPHEVARLRGHDRVYRYLMERSPPDIRLLQAAREGDVTGLEALLRADPDIIASMTDQLHWYLMCQSPNVLEVAVRHGGDVNVVNRDGVTPLHQACWQGELDKVKWLVAHDADPRIRDAAHASTPLGWADYNHQTDVVEYLKKNTEPDIVDATVLGMTDVALALLEADPSLATGTPAASPLRAAAYTGNLVLVEAFVAAGADPKASNPESGLNALEMAQQQGHDDVVRFLEGRGDALP